MIQNMFINKQHNVCLRPSKVEIQALAGLLL